MRTEILRNYWVRFHQNNFIREIRINHFDIKLICFVFLIPDWSNRRLFVHTTGHTRNVKQHQLFIHISWVAVETLQAVKRAKQRHRQTRKKKTIETTFNNIHYEHILIRIKFYNTWIFECAHDRAITLTAREKEIKPKATPETS